MTVTDSNSTLRFLSPSSYPLLHVYEIASKDRNHIRRNGLRDERLTIASWFNTQIFTVQLNQIQYNNYIKPSEARILDHRKCVSSLLTDGMSCLLGS